MERDFETNSSHLVSSRLSLWCPVCGAREGQPCKEHKKGLRFDAHNAIVTGTVPRSVTIPDRFEPSIVRKDTPVRIAPARKDAPKRGWTPTGWMQ
jgi:hypothetical protein